MELLQRKRWKNHFQPNDFILWF